MFLAFQDMFFQFQLHRKSTEHILSSHIIAHNMLHKSCWTSIISIEYGYLFVSVLSIVPIETAVDVKTSFVTEYDPLDGTVLLNHSDYHTWWSVCNL
jgi:hypothetical protein